MATLPIADFRAKIANYCDQVSGSHEPLLITRGKKPSVVVISAEDYSSLQETFYLMKSPKNAERLLKSIQSVKKGGFKTRKLME